MTKTIFEKVIEGMTIEKLANLMVFETIIDDGDYNYEETWEESWTNRYKINIPEEFRDIARVFFDAIGEIDDEGYGLYSERDEAVQDAIMLLEQVEDWKPLYDENGQCLNDHSYVWLKKFKENG